LALFNLFLFSKAVKLRNCPQIEFALSRGFAISGLHCGETTQGGTLGARARPPSRLPWANIVCPFQGTQLAAAPDL
jgi:hypothetical protein